MSPSEEFRRHAAECKSMAGFLHDPGSRETWNSLAERWLRCAEHYEQQLTATHHDKKTKLHRRVSHRLAH
jgi:hypothetical protein